MGVDLPDPVPVTSVVNRPPSARSRRYSSRGGRWPLLGQMKVPESHPV